MLIENMAMAFHAIKANKMRSFLTMLGIIIGIGSVISIVSIGDTCGDCSRIFIRTWGSPRPMSRSATGSMMCV